MPLRVTVELIPRGDEARKKVVGFLEVENTADHPEHPQRANYKYRMVGPVNGGELGLWHQGVIADVDRERGYWAHIKEILSRLDCESSAMRLD
jgi:hypothetical protein